MSEKLSPTNCVELFTGIDSNGTSTWHKMSKIEYDAYIANPDNAPFIPFIPNEVTTQTTEEAPDTLQEDLSSTVEI